MNIDELLRNELQHVAGSLDVPPVPPAALAELVRRGEVEKATFRRLRVVSAVAAAACLALIAALTIGIGDERSAEPEPSQNLVSRLPMGAPPAIPYARQDGTVVLDGRTIPGKWSSVQGRGPSLLGIPARGVAQVYVDGTWTPLPEGSSYSSISESSRWLAYMVEADSRVVVRDLQQDRTYRSGVVGGSGHSWLRGVDDSGRAYVSEELGPSAMFDPTTGDLVPLRSAKGRVVEVIGTWNGGPAVQLRRPPPHEHENVFTFHAVVRAGGLVASPSRSVQVRVEGDASPGGTWMVFASDADGGDPQLRPENEEGFDEPDQLPVDSLTVIEMATGKRRTFPVIEGVPAGDPLWESDDVVLVTVGKGVVAGEGPSPTMARCHVRSQLCEFAVPPEE